MIIIHIDTSTTVCSVAVSNRGKCVFEISDNAGQNHATKLSPFIEQVLEYLQSNQLTPDAVSVSAGPGSYTGLRIGVSTAKGLCYGFNIPLIAVPTLEILAAGIVQSMDIEPDALLCPMIDARRMEVYTALYSPTLEIEQEVSAEIITEDSFKGQLERGKTYFMGNGAEKCKSVLTHPNACFIDNTEVLARDMIQSAEMRFTAGNYADVAYFEPFYLKEFQATTAKSKI